MGVVFFIVYFLVVKFLDYDQDLFIYIWVIGEEVMQVNVFDFIYVFENFGIYDVKLIVIDIKGE